MNIDYSGIQIKNIPDSAITEKGPQCVHGLTAGEASDNVTVIACCNTVGQFLLPVQIFKVVDTKREFGDGLPPQSDEHIKRKS
jgi:hypothetical protein